MINVKKRFQILDGNNGTSSNFVKLKSAVVEAAKESIPSKKMEKRNMWMTCKIFDLLEERRATKLSGNMKYDESKVYMWMCKRRMAEQ